MKIGIITMHKVYNNGSALQAFALQRAIDKLKHAAILIDYDFNAGKKKKKKIWTPDYEAIRPLLFAPAPH